jgi:ribonucleoside-diphosphate reductase alpha chain
MTSVSPDGGQKGDPQPETRVNELSLEVNSTDELRTRLRELEGEAQRLRAELEHAQRRPNREQLPATRQSLTHKFTVGQIEGYVTVGLFDDNRPGELFLKVAKEGSTVGGLMDTIGILTSLALQYGVPVETLARKFEHVSFEPSGWTRDPTIRRASSVVDYIFRWLGLQFSEAYRQEKLAGIAPENEQRCELPAQQST